MEYVGTDRAQAYGEKEEQSQHEKNEPTHGAREGKGQSCEQDQGQQGCHRSAPLLMPGKMADEPNVGNGWQADVGMYPLGVGTER